MPTGQFSCTSCGKAYAWKPQLAGKRVKCKCGAPISVPAEDPALAQAPPPEFDDLYALAEGNADVPVAPAPIARPAPALAVAAVGAGAGTAAPAPRANRPGGSGAGTGARKPNLLGYAQMGGGKRRLADQEEASTDIFFHPVKDLYIPAGLVVLGMALSVFYLLYQNQVDNIGTAILAVGILSLISLILAVPGILITIKLFDLGIGPIGPGILKIAACAIAPGAIGEVISLIFTGSLGGYIGWCLAVGIGFTIFMKLLEMDFIETLACTCIIFVVRTWIVYAIMAAVFGGILGPSFGRGPLGALGGGGGGGGRINIAGEIHVDEDDSIDAIRARQHDEEALQILPGAGGTDGKQWIEGAPNRVLAKQSREKSLEIIRGFYAAGVHEVRVWPHKDAATGQESVNLMIVCPNNDDKASRPKVMDNLKKLARLLGRVTPRDRGERFFIVRMITREDELKSLSTGSSSGGGFGSGATPKGTAAEDEDDEE
jgi:hypothetical protein